MFDIVQQIKINILDVSLKKYKGDTHLPYKNFLIIYRKGVSIVRTKKYRLNLDEYEVNIILKSLLQLRNEVIANGGYGDSVNELIEKVAYAPRAKFKF